MVKKIFADVFFFFIAVPDISGTNKDNLVADFFCGSGTTGAVAERLGRRWIITDLGRFAIHTSRKRMIELQRKLHEEGKPYRAFDVYNLGRYERQWWQKEHLHNADEEHRRFETFAQRVVWELELARRNLAFLAATAATGLARTRVLRPRRIAMQREDDKNA